MSYSYTTTETFTRTHARYIASKIAADLRKLQLYYDRPKAEWPRSPDGESIAMYTHPVDLEALLADAPI